MASCTIAFSFSRAAVAILVLALAVPAVVSTQKFSTTSGNSAAGLQLGTFLAWVGLFWVGVMVSVKKLNFTKTFCIHKVT